MLSCQTMFIHNSPIESVFGTPDCSFIRMYVGNYPVDSIKSFWSTRVKSLNVLPFELFLAACKCVGRDPAVTVPIRIPTCLGVFKVLFLAYISWWGEGSNRLRILLQILFNIKNINLWLVHVYKAVSATTRTNL